MLSLTFATLQTLFGCTDNEKTKVDPNLELAVDTYFSKNLDKNDWKARYEPQYQVSFETVEKAAQARLTTAVIAYFELVKGTPELSDNQINFLASTYKIPYKKIKSEADKHFQACFDDYESGNKRYAIDNPNSSQNYSIPYEIIERYIDQTYGSKNAYEDHLNKLSDKKQKAEQLLADLREAEKLNSYYDRTCQKFMESSKDYSTLVFYTNKVNRESGRPSSEPCIRGDHHTFETRELDTDSADFIKAEHELMVYTWEESTQTFVVVEESQEVQMATTVIGEHLANLLNYN